MPSSTRSCPKCHASLSVRAFTQGAVRCPHCGATVPVERDDSDGAIQREVRPVAMARRPRVNVTEETQPKSGSSLGLFLVLGLGLGCLGLLVLGGGLAAMLFFTHREPDVQPASVATVDKPMAAPLPPQVPVAQVDLHPVAVDPQPEKPLPPPQAPIQAVPREQGQAGALPLKELKAASVYVKTMTATMQACGSGFVVRTQGDTVFVVTNYHVISPPREEMGGPLPPFVIPRGPMGPLIPGMPIGPRMPGMPIGPRIPPRGILQPMQLGQQGLSLTVVFSSGTDREQSLPALLVGDDPKADLAVLKVSGVRNAPRPIDCERTPELMETMPVVAFGYPFGEKLDPNKQNPSITVTKGAVSALRQDRGELGEVQLDLDLNPGNSGGPVVDDKGALIGVAVAKVTNSRIGFAVPVPKLKRLLQGRIDPPTTIQSQTVQGQTQIRVLAHASDPLGNLREPTLLFGSATELRMPPRSPQGWKALDGAKPTKLVLQGTKAIATLEMTTPANGAISILAQVSYRNTAGQTIYGEPRTLNLNVATPAARIPQPNQPAQPPGAANPLRPAKGEALTKLLAELKSADEASKQRAANTLRTAPPRERRDAVAKGLIELFTSPDPQTRKTAVQALVACDPKEAAPALTKLLNDETPGLRHEALNAMKTLKDARVAEAVAARLPSDSIPAAETLKSMGQSAEKAVLPYLSAQYAGQTRFWAFNVVKEIGTPASIPALEAVEGPDTLHARGVLQAVRERAPLTADEWTTALDDLKSSDAAKRTRAARRIAATPPSEERRAEVVSRLEFLLNDQSGDVRSAAAKGLRHWGGPKAVSILARRLDGFDPGFHAILIDLLAELSGEQAVAAIARRLTDVHDNAIATQALKAMEPAVAEKAVLPLLNDSNVFVRTAALKVLAEVGGRDSIAPLEKLANDNNVFYSNPAKQALEAIHDRVDEGK